MLYFCVRGTKLVLFFLVTTMKICLQNSLIHYLRSSIDQNSSPNRRTAENSTGIRIVGCAVDATQKADSDIWKPKTWSIDAVNKVTLMRRMEGTPSTSSCTYYVGGPFTFFLFSVEDEQLSLISYLVSRSPKVWYIILAKVRLVSSFFCSEDSQSRLSQSSLWQSSKDYCRNQYFLTPHC